ncbi:hypothetical protein OGAPHI_004147 [Ogataea philodendri]|uniref:Centromere protein H C-terminal domain-containing protein n=1 Tax=Ogataea philodendri TaxID=1378263 RepID=A0A9P8T4H5_9ASCO|nr:uncharacterized protein OGAPHI_004147 [Ogataea philodendri]KAH3665958.1 hypothetical protein OGAPHI_004147 [Ogataea philodendri]
MESLENQHTEIYRKLVAAVDELLVVTKKAKLTQVPEIVDREYDEALNTMPDLHLALLQADILNKDTDETVNAFLNQLLNIRRRIIEQHMITYPILRAIHTEDETQVTELIRERDSTIKEYIEQSKLKNETQESLNKSSQSTVKDLEELRGLVQMYLELVEENKDLAFQNKIREEEQIDGLEQLKARHITLIKRNLALSSFNISLISSLSKSDVYSDEYLRDTLLFCGDYDDYELEENI